MPRKLKVFRMPIGFEDAYVAAPSRKAALEAWGAEHDQFARGVAEEVTDPKLTKGPLARPGEVIRKSRGDLASQLKALPPRPKAKAAKPQPPKKAAKPKPPPKRDKVDAAERALKETQQRHREERAKLEAQLNALQARQEKEVAKLTAARDAARAAFRAALEKWSG
jgi:hypothetical protein